MLYLCFTNEETVAQERLEHLLKVTQLMSENAGVWTQALRYQRLCHVHNSVVPLPLL